MSLNQILDRFAWNGLGLVVLAAPLAVGAVHWPVWMTLAALAGALLLGLSLLYFRTGRTVRLDGFVVLGLAMGGVMLFQLLPLGESLLATLSPLAHEGLLRSRELGFEVPSRISLQPVNTVQMLCFLGMAVSVYVVAFNLSYRDGTGNKILAMVGIGGAVVSLLAFAQYVVGTDRILGFYAPSVGMGKVLVFSTFVNNNNATAFLNLAVLVLAGQWQKAQFGKTKGIYAGLVLLTAAGSLAMLSRGGMLALLVAGGFLTMLSRWASGQRRRTSYAAATVVGVGLTLACVVIFLVLFNVMLNHVEKTQLIPFGEDLKKVQVWEKSKDAIPEVKIVGAGAGAFEAVFGPRNDFSPDRTFYHAENELLEPLLEFGVPLGIFFLVMSLVLLGKRLLSTRADAYYLGAIAGLVAIILQSVTDFGIRIPGVFIPAAATLGALSGAHAKVRAKQKRWRLGLSGLKFLPLAATVYMLTIAAGAWVGENSSANVYRLLSQRSVKEPSREGEATSSLANHVLGLHAWDSHMFTLWGKNREKWGDLDEARRLYERATELCPACIPARIGISRLHLRRGDEEAALRQLLEVAEDVPDRRFAIFGALHASSIDPRTVAAVWHTNEDMMYELVRYVSQRDGEQMAEVLLKETIKRVGHEPRFLNELGQLYLQVIKPEKADAVATYLMGMFPESKYGYVIQARVFVQQRRPYDALLMYEEARLRVAHGDVELDLETMSVLAATRSWDKFETIATELRLSLGDNSTYRSRFHQMMATREEMRGEYFAALAELDQAESASPLNIQVPLHKARLYVKLNRPEQAAAEYRKAMKIDPLSGRAAEGLRNLETAVRTERHWTTPL